LSNLFSKFRTFLRPAIVELRRLYLVHIWGMDIGHGTVISLSARLDKTNPRGIHIGEYTAINFDAVILTHDFRNLRHTDTWIGDRCMIGGRSIIYPGVKIGNNCVVGLGSVVMGNVADGTIVSGFPARVIGSGIETESYGVRTTKSDEVEK
jgi:acetyltransferase-like isoleucine patch superfamily enzyme